MKKGKQNADAENQLVQKIKSGDELALYELCHLYRPLVNSIKQRYHVRYYDSQDWDQDALIVCYFSALSFDREKGRFGSYYKVRLVNHANSLIRYNLAYRRKALTEAVSFEKAHSDGLHFLHQEKTIVSEVPLSESLNALVKSLSYLEINTLLVALGIYRREEVLKRLNVSQLTLTRAHSRLLQKTRKALLE